jgi:uncharacterized protein YaeQ
VALTSTVHIFAIDLADADRSVYETIELRVARHPSESAEFLIARVLAYCLEYAEGIAFSRGLSDPDDPAISIRSRTGDLLEWIDVGSPDAARLHRASKAARRVAVYAHKEPSQFLRRLEGERIHRADALEIYAIDPRLIAALVGRLERRMAFHLSVSDRELTVSIDTVTLSGAVRRVALQ